jgi:hypothetical protein
MMRKQLSDVTPSSLQSQNGGCVETSFNRSASVWRSGIGRSNSLIQREWAVKFLDSSMEQWIK